MLILRLSFIFNFVSHFSGEVYIHVFALTILSKAGLITEDRAVTAIIMKPTKWRILRDLED